MLVSFMRIARRRLLVAVMCVAAVAAVAQNMTYENIEGFSDETNARLRKFMYSTMSLRTHKVAVFDCDGTLLGQAPYYMCDEALIDYVTECYGKDKDVMEKLREAIENNTDEIVYAHRMVEFFAGLPIDKVEMIGRHCFEKKYKGQVFPEMKQLVNNLKNFGFDVYVVTASHELLYQGVCSDQFGIPTDHVIGVRQKVDCYGKTKNEIITPISVEAGKAEAIMTFIKTRPLFVGGNSRGDVEMMRLATGLRMVINPDDTKPLDKLGGRTLREYWSEDPGCIIEQCNEVPTPGVEWSGSRYNLPVNATHEK